MRTRLIAVITCLIPTISAQSDVSLDRHKRKRVTLHLIDSDLA